MAQTQSQRTPRRYKPAVGVKWAKLLKGKPPFIDRKRAKGRFLTGVRYERQVQEHLALLALPKPQVVHMEGPWVEFQDESGRRWCQLDALLLDHSHKFAIIVEVKYQHCAEAWWQLTSLYEPVIRAIYPGYICGRLEIVHWFDPETVFPEKFDLTDSPFRIPHANKVAVYIYNPRRKRQSSSRFPGLALDGHNGSEGVSETTGPVRISEGTTGSSGDDGVSAGRVVHGRRSSVPAGAEGETPQTRSRTEMKGAANGRS